MWEINLGWASKVGSFLLQKTERGVNTYCYFIFRSTATTVQLEHPYLRLRQSSPPMCSAMRESGQFYIRLQSLISQVSFTSSCHNQLWLKSWLNVFFRNAAAQAAAAGVRQGFQGGAQGQVEWHSKRKYSILISARALSKKTGHQSIILAVELISATAAVCTSLLKRRRSSPATTAAIVGGVIWKIICMLHQCKKA